MRTTLDLPDETFRQLKAQAAINGMKLKELVCQLIQRGLAAGATTPGPEQPPCALPIAIKRVPGTPLNPALSNAELYAMLNAQDLVQYHSAFQPSDKTQ
ncbi:hypothetical protein [Rhodoferax sp.]|uniref:hypothetical protein n=1 Tax=Rhodoferax sp. TaxID=50421 RepID=UPI002626C7C2|nr:hypothetical protein [Rhodoferax sp.]MDD2810707.1 hypothetical protein [Rhodoferax sp.]MDD4943817.1 hypothetical protein [Rhodoferax sp.]MDD5478221.1 hypothetical protein [Rhodoferax sp.]